MSSSIPAATIGFLSPARGEALGRAAREHWNELESPRSGAGKRSLHDSGTADLESGKGDTPQSAAGKPGSNGRGTASDLPVEASAERPGRGGEAQPPGLPSPSRRSDPPSAARGGRSEASRSVPPEPRASNRTAIVAPSRGDAAPTEPRIAQAVAEIERTFAASGSHAAAQALHRNAQGMSPPAAARLLEAAHPSVLMIVDALAASGGTARSEPPAAAEPVPVVGGPLAGTAKSLVSIAMVLDAGAGHEPTRRLVAALADRIRQCDSPERDAIQAVLARGAGVGTGFLLPLALASYLDERGKRQRSPALFVLLAASLDRMEERIAAAHNALIGFVGPLVFEWASWRNGSPDEECAKRLHRYLAERTDFLSEFAALLHRVEKVGREAVRALEDLSVIQPDAVLAEARTRLALSEATEFTVLRSPAAHREVRRMAEARSAPTPGGGLLDAVRLTLTGIGFEAPRAAFLADEIAVRSFTSPLGAGWTRLDGFDAVREGGEAFQRLLQFLDGSYRVPAALRVLSFADIDAAETQPTIS